jgi:hypothetical protein
MNGRLTVHDKGLEALGPESLGREPRGTKARYSQTAQSTSTQWWQTYFPSFPGSEISQNRGLLRLAGSTKRIGMRPRAKFVVRDVGERLRPEPCSLESESKTKGVHISANQQSAVEIALFDFP